MNKQALICEDNLTSAYCIKAMLEKFGYSSEIAKTTKETIEFLSKNKYDLLTLDILLPDGDGLELAKKIKNLELAKDLPIIVISATKKEESKLDFDNNVVYWLEKSFDINTFEKAIGKIMTEQSKNKVEILHVENDQDLLSLIDITLNDIANVTPVRTLDEARKYVQTKPFDIIILDYVFPEGTSDKLIPDIKYGVNKNAKIVMFSAYEENRIIARYVDEIIIKTNVSFDEFKTVIEKFIGQKEQSK
jgi:CheY-like chemotaxis protein